MASAADREGRGRARVLTPRVRSALRSAAARMYWTLPHFLVHLTGSLLILTYHRVVPSRELATTFVPPGMYVTPETLERHLRFLAAHFELLTFQDLLAMWHEDAWDRTRRYCAITFDDGWLDNYVYAYPLLRACRAPATIFLPTDLIGTRDWLWSDRLGHVLSRYRARDAAGALREALAPIARRYPALMAACRLPAPDAFDSLIDAARRLPEQARADLIGRLEAASGAAIPDVRRFLDWDEAREMSNHGIAFGSHTCSHAILTGLGPDALRAELQRPLDVLRRQSVNRVPVLSYPNGDYTEAVVSEARAAGYEAAVTTRPGLEPDRPADLFRLKRVGVHDDVSGSIPLLTWHIARRSRQGLGTDAPA